MRQCKKHEQQNYLRNHCFAAGDVLANGVDAGVGGCMTCKHRWHEANFGIKHRPPGSYWYECQRCHKTIFTQLTGKL